jgi:MFS family permease
MTTQPTTRPQALWRNHAFVIFGTARVLSTAGTGITMVIMPVLMYQLTRSPAATALLSAIETTPYLLFGLFAGALADRADTNKIMVINDMAAGLMLGSIPVSRHQLTPRPALRARSPTGRRARDAAVAVPVTAGR